MMGHREPMKSGDEYDAFTGWRKVLFWSPGQLRRIKRAFNRRVRRKAKLSLADYRPERDSG